FRSHRALPSRRADGDGGAGEDAVSAGAVHLSRNLRGAAVSDRSPAVAGGNPVRNANPLHRPLTGVEAGRGGGKLVDDGIDDRNNDRSNDRDNGRIDEWLEFAVRVGTQATIRVWRARGFAGRLRGLIARPLPAPGSGLWIEPCAAVHTFGVRGPLDLVFV